MNDEFEETGSFVTPPLVRYVIGGYPMMMPLNEAEYYAIVTGQGEIVPFRPEEIAQAEVNAEELAALFDEADQRIGTLGTELTPEILNRMVEKLMGDTGSP